MPVVHVRTTGDLRRLANQMREEDRRFPSQLRSRLIATVRPYVAEQKRNARNIPVYGRKHTGLRRRVAAGVYSQVRTTRAPGVSIRTRMQDASEAVIPRGMDRAQGWRHPVYGNDDVWVNQRTGGSWFREPLARKQPEIQEALRDEIGDML